MFGEIELFFVEVFSMKLRLIIFFYEIYIQFFIKRCKILFQEVVDLYIFNVTVRINLKGNYIKIEFVYLYRIL